MCSDAFSAAWLERATVDLQNAAPQRAKRMTRATARLMAIGLLLVSAGLAMRALVPNGEKGGADFFMGLLMGTGIAIEILALVQARRLPLPPKVKT